MLAIATRSPRVQAWDDALEAWIGPHRLWWRYLAGAATLTGEKFVHPVLAAISFVVLLNTRPGPAMRFAIPLATASLGGITAHHVVKFFYRRPRPRIALDRDKTEAAFPSGHTTNATAVLTTSAFLLVREGLVSVQVAAVCVVLLCLATGASRVALGWHWGSDVVGGWMSGLFVAALAAALFVSMQ